MSINDRSRVVFVGEDHAGRSGTYVRNPGEQPRLVTFPGSSVDRLYGRGASINDSVNGNDQIVARDLIVGDASSGSLVRRWSADGTFTDIAASMHLFTLPEPEEFDSLLSITDINDNDQVVFVGVDASSNPPLHKLQVRSSLVGASQGISINIGDFAANSGLRPQISNTTEVVFRSPSGQSIFKTDPMSPGFKSVAGVGDGFQSSGSTPAVGRSPGISDDGRIVVFFGNCSTEQGGPGIFASMQDPEDSRKRKFFRLAGKPGELGRDLSGEPLRILDFATRSSSGTVSTDSRVGIGGANLEWREGNINEYYVTFLAMDPADQKETLWQVRFDAGVDFGRRLVFDTKTPQVIAKVGQNILGLTLEDIEVYDPISKDGNVAFWARVAGGGNAVFLAKTSPDTDGDGLLDFWEESGIDIDEDGYLDLDVRSLGADSQKRDLFLELDWLPGRGPDRESIQQLTQIFQGAPETLKHKKGIDLHVDPVYSSQVASVIGNPDVVYMDVPGRVIPGSIDLDAESLQTVKDQSFGGQGATREARQYVYHYALIANYVSTISIDSQGSRRNDKSITIYPTVTATPLSTTTGTPATLTTEGNPFVKANSLKGHVVKIVSGAGVGQYRYIKGNTSNRVELENDWDEGNTPNSTSKFVILAGDSGFAEIFGNDLILSLGLRTKEITNESQTLLHELGHNFGLKGDIVRKGTYLSAMNYAYQLGSQPFDPSNPQLDSYFVPDYSRNEYVDEKGDLNYTDTEWSIIRMDFHSFYYSFNNSVVSGSSGAQRNAFELNPAQVRDIQRPQDPELPLLSIMSPANASTIPITSEVAIRIFAQDNVQIDSVRVQFDRNGDGDLTDAGESQYASPNGDGLYEADMGSVFGSSGSRSIAATVTDSHGNVNLESISILVVGGAINSPPSAQKDFVQVVPNASVAIPVLINDSDRDGDAVFVKSVAQPMHGTVVLNAEGVVFYSPQPDYVGSDSFAYTISDGHELDESTVGIEVRSKNLAPSLLALDRQFVVIGNAVRIQLRADDPNVEQKLTYVLGSNNIAGATLDASTGDFLWATNATTQPGIYFANLGVYDSGSPLLSDWKTLWIDVRAGEARVLSVNPKNGISVSHLDSVSIDFSVAMNSSTVTNRANYRLLHDQIGEISIESIAYSDSNDRHQAILSVSTVVTIPPGQIRVRIDSQSLKSAHGQSLSKQADALVALLPENNSISFLGITQNNGFVATDSESLSGLDSPRSLDASDVDQDGIVDIVSTSASTGEIVIYFGTGKGDYSTPMRTRLPPTDSGESARPQQVRIADWNMDGAPDILVFDNASAKRIHVYLGDGNGAFVIAADTPILLSPLDQGTILGIADFTGDGQTDVAVSGPYVDNAFTGSVAIYGKDPFLGYTLTSQLPTERSGWSPISGEVADFNNDGRADLAISNFGYYLANPGTQVLLSSQNGLQPPLTPLFETFGNGQLTTGDFTGDGNSDLVVLHDLYRNSEGITDGSVVSVLVGNGRGGFDALPNQVLGRRGLGLAQAGDLNGDQKLDLVIVASPWSSGSAFPEVKYASTWNLLGDGKGNFQPASNSPITIEPTHLGSIGEAIVKDVNGDGSPDAVFATTDGWGIRIVWSDHTGAMFAAPKPIVTGLLFSGNSSNTSRKIVDINNDSLLDLLTLEGSHSNKKLFVYEGQLNGSYYLAHVVPVPGSAFRSWLDVADVNNDQRIDVLISTHDDGFTVLLGAGDGTFSPTVSSPYRVQGFEYLDTNESDAIADLNGDGKLDILVTVASFQGDQVTPSGWAVYFGDGSGNFFFNRNTYVPFPEGYYDPYVISNTRPTIRDFDSDGKPDFLVWTLEMNTGILTVYHGNGNGTFRRGKVSVQSYPSRATNYEVQDFNGDGKIDLLGYSKYAVEVYLGDDTGGYQMLGGATIPMYDYRSVGGSYYYFDRAASGDFNGDGYIDVALTKTSSWYLDHNEFMKTVAVFLNDGQGRFLPAISVPCNGFPKMLQSINQNRWIELSTFSLAISMWPPRIHEQAIPFNQQVLTGKSTPKSVVRVVYLENVIGQATTDEGGNWRMTLGSPLMIGNHSIQLYASSLTGENSALTFAVLSVLKSTHLWHNPRDGLDVDDDRSISPLDVLVIINYINTHGVGAVPNNAPPIFGYLDTTDDDDISPLDVLIVINFINQSQTSRSTQIEFESNDLSPLINSWNGGISSICSWDDLFGQYSENNKGLSRRAPWFVDRELLNSKKSILNRTFGKDR